MAVTVDGGRARGGGSADRDGRPPTARVLAGPGRGGSGARTAAPSAGPASPPPGSGSATEGERRFSLRASWAGLTSRGGSFLSAGVVALLAALVLRQTDLVRIAVLLLALPAVAVLRMALVSLHVTVRRDASPRRGYAGQPVTVAVSLTNRGRQRTPTLLVEDGTPEELLVDTRVVAPPLPGRAAARVSYTVVPPRRGRYVLGPARVHAVEPFGLLERTWRAAGTDELLVRPRPVPLSGMLRPARLGGESDAAAGVAAAGAMDMTVREYRDGDDLRRVHWPTTARRGELMVRRDERPQDLRLTIVLDARAEGHRRLGGAVSLEWAVVAAASVATTAADHGYDVTMLGDGVPGSGPADGLDGILDRLAVVSTGPASGLAEAADLLDGTSPSLVVAVVGELGPAEVGVLADRARAARRVALVLDGTPAPAARGAAAPVASRAGATPGSRALAAGGWTVVTVAAGAGVDEAWSTALGAVGG